MSLLSTPKLYETIKKESQSLSLSIFNWFDRRNLTNVYEDIFQNVDISKLNAKKRAEMIHLHFNEQHFCVMCGKPTTFKGFARGYNLTCSNKCFFAHRSLIQQGENNTSHRMTKETKQSMKDKLSDIMKGKIQRGEWTPCVTNSWANSRVRIQIDNCEYKFRSTWETFFWLLHQQCEYEKLRVAYEEDGKKKIYIVDFIDVYNKKVFEVKPLSETSNKRNLLKYESIKKWCDEKGYEFKYINELFLFENIYDLEQNEIVKTNVKLSTSLKRLKYESEKYKTNTI